MTDQEFSELVVRLRLRGYARRHGLYSPWLDDDDLDQVARLGAWDAVRDWNPELGPLDSFVYLVVRRKLISAIRSSRYDKHEILNGAESLSRPVSGPEGDLSELGDLLPDRDADTDLSEALVRREELATVARARETLSRRERSALDLSARDASLAEIQAEIGGVPTVWGPTASRGLAGRARYKSAENALDRARRKIRDALADAA